MGNKEVVSAVDAQLALHCARSIVQRARAPTAAAACWFTPTPIVIDSIARIAIPLTLNEILSWLLLAEHSMYKIDNDLIFPPRLYCIRSRFIVIDCFNSSNNRRNAGCCFLKMMNRRVIKLSFK